MNSPLYKKAFGAKYPFEAEKQLKKVTAFKVVNEISGRDET